MASRRSRSACKKVAKPSSELESSLLTKRFREDEDAKSRFCG